MNDVKIFNNADFGSIRTITINNEPWFVGKDIATALGYQNGSRDINRHVDEDDRQNYQNSTFESNRGLTIINESGLYSLILGSKLESAKRFKKWVTGEVLPSIRKNGMYAETNLLDNPDLLMATALQLANERMQKLQLENMCKDQQIAELKPKADYTDRILNNKKLVTATQIAKDYGMSGQTFNSKLHQLGVQYKQSGQWLLYAKYQDKGYTHSETIDITRSNGIGDTVMNTKWTQKGRLFLYQLLKKNGILPVIERN